MSTIYWSVYPSAQANPSIADVIGGTVANAAAQGSDTAPASDGDFLATATGLSASTSYKIAAVWSDGVDDSNLVVSAAIVTGVTGTIGLATETSAALSVTPTAGVTRAIGIAVESNTAFSITPVSGDTTIIGLASETDTALPITPIANAIVTLGLVTETSLALSITPLEGGVSVSLGLATQTDSALSITPVASAVYEIGLATEINAALSITALDGAYIVRCTLVDASGKALPNLESLSYAWFDEADPANLTSPVVKGLTESTDGSGVIEVPISGSSLVPGDVGLLVLRSSDGVSLGAYNLSVQ